MKEKKKRAVLRVFRLAKCKTAKYTVGLIFSAAGILASAIPFYTIYRIIKIYLLASLHGGSPDLTAVWSWTGFTALSIGLGIIFAITGSVLCHISAFNALFDLRMQILEKMGKQSIGYFTQTSTGSIQKMLDDNIDQMEEIIAHSFPNIIGAALVLISLALLLFSIHPVLALTVFGSLALAFVIQFSAFGGKKGQERWGKLHQSSTALQAGFSEYIAGMEEEKIFGTARFAAKNLSEKIINYREQMLLYLKRTSPVFGAYKVITLSLLIFILAAGSILLAFDTANHQLMLQIIMFMVISPAVISPLMELVELGADLKNLSARIDQIEALFSQPDLPDGWKKLSSQNINVQFDTVSFSYQNPSDADRKLALDKVSMKLNSGTLTALVGPSGGGKSTVGQLLARFWDAERGKITCNGVDIKEYSMDSLSDNIAFVFQDSFIFSKSVFENIAMNRKVSRKAVQEAAKAARCHEFIMQLPDGYDTRLGDGGHSLSGGEAQRIAIARAILKDAKVIILDEAMAFTDAENELALREAMEVLLAGKTVLMIAHRLYSVKDADCIYVMEEGQITESGKHSELMEQNGLYTKLWKLQNEMEQWHLNGSAVHV